MTAAGRLRPGRHGLTRDEVRASQRQRMLAAMVEAVAADGYGPTPVADVIRRAGVSRATFYEHFASKEDCFLAAFDEVADGLAAHVSAAASGDAGRGADASAAAGRLDAALGAYLEALASQPTVARTFLIEVYGAGSAALKRRTEVLGRFTDLVAEIAGVEDDPQRRFACEALAGALSSMVTMRIALDDPEGILALRAPMLALARDVLGLDPGDCGRGS